MCILLLCLSLAACSSRKNSDESTVEPDAAPETTTIRLAFYPHGHVLNVIAEDQGYLEEEGIKVEYVNVESDVQVFQYIKEGKIDVASNAGTNLPLQRIAEGQDLTIFGGYLLTGCMPIFAKVDTKWNSFEDLIGKTMACEANVYAVSGPLIDKGHDPLNEVNWLALDDQNERIKAVKEGRADFGLVGTSLNYAINTDPELKVCTYASDILPDYSCCRIEAKTQWVNENPNTVKALLRAWIRAMEYFESHHDETVALLVKETGQDEAFIRAYLDNPHCNINIDPMKSAIRRAWYYMGRLGLLNNIAKKKNIDDHINTTLYKEALDECQEKYGNDDQQFYEKMQGQYARNN